MKRTLIAGLIALMVATAAGAMAQEAKPLDTTDTQWSGVQAELVEVKLMSDNTVRVRWRWHNTQDQKVQLFDHNGYGIAIKQDTYLIDPANKKKHFVVTDDKGVPVAAPLPNVLGVILKPKESISLWAKFPAPPANVQKVNVVIAKTTPFEDVIIAK